MEKKNVNELIHELNNHLHVIQGFAQYARLTQDLKEQREALAQIIQGARKAVEAAGALSLLFIKNNKILDKKE